MIINKIKKIKNQSINNNFNKKTIKEQPIKYLYNLVVKDIKDFNEEYEEKQSKVDENLKFTQDVGFYKFITGLLPLFILIIYTFFIKKLEWYRKIFYVLEFICFTIILGFVNFNIPNFQIPLINILAIPIGMVSCILFVISIFSKAT